MSEKQEHGWAHGLLEILGEGLFEDETLVLFAVVLIGVGIVIVLYQMATDPQFAIGSLGGDISAHLDSLSINPDKWR
jgi:hypothetical protein